MEDADTWQGLRRFVEDSMVLKDPFELFVVQNVVLDGLLYPLVKPSSTTCSRPRAAPRWRYGNS